LTRAITSVNGVLVNSRKTEPSRWVAAMSSPAIPAWSDDRRQTACPRSIRQPGSFKFVGGMAGVVRQAVNRESKQKQTTAHKRGERRWIPRAIDDLAGRLTSSGRFRPPVETGLTPHGP
jgi:hypothetical protein